MEYETKLEHYKYRSENYAGVSNSLDTIENSMRNAIRFNAIRFDDGKSLISLQQVYALLIAASAEARLQKILFEPNKFTEDEIISIFKIKVHLDRWKGLVKIAFSKRYSCDPSDLDTMLNVKDKGIYDRLIEVLDKKLSTVINIRNKLAHGQWVYPFVNDRSISSLNDITVSSDNKRVFELENFLTLKLKRKMINSILDIVRDLVVSHRTLHRDIDSHYRKIENYEQGLGKRSYPKYEYSLVKRYEKHTRYISELKKGSTSPNVIWERIRDILRRLGV